MNTNHNAFLQLTPRFERKKLNSCLQIAKYVFPNFFQTFQHNREHLVLLLCRIYKKAPDLFKKPTIFPFAGQPASANYLLWAQYLIVSL